MSDPSTDDTDQYNNPMRFSIRDRTIDVSEFPVVVTEIIVRPSEGNVYVHWRPLRPALTETGSISDE